MEIGRTLYCLNGEKVKVVAFDSQSIFVEYQGRTYSRPVSAIGKTLFSSKKAAQKEYNFIKERDLNQRGFYRIIISVLLSSRILMLLVLNGRHLLMLSKKMDMSK